MLLRELPGLGIMPQQSITFFLSFFFDLLIFHFDLKDAPQPHLHRTPSCTPMTGVETHERQPPLFIYLLIYFRH